MKPIKIFAALLLILSFGACNKTNDQATGVGDALIVAKKINNQVVYGISLYAYTFSSFASVTAVNSSDPTKTYTLSSNQGYSTNFYYEMPDEEFTTEKPAAGTYTFSATFKNGATNVFTDELTSNVLDLPNLTKCEYNETGSQLQLAWDLLANADGYAIDILDGENVVFASAELANDIKSLAITASSSGWATDYTPVAGKTYTVRILGFLLEANSTNTYNVQATSVTDASVVWGN